jgi:predicted metal-dependent hydrolase
MWTPAHPEYGHHLDGGSLALPYLEPYLIRVMKRAQRELGDLHPGLRANIDIFNRQEANHYQLHSRYNAMLRNHYDGLEIFEAEIEADFDRMFRERSLQFNVAYSAGFETTGMVMAEMFFEGCPEALAGADPAVEALWGWHLAEEFEHRCVAFDVYQVLFGSWLGRLRGFAFQTKHLQGFGRRVMAHMIRQDELAGRIPPRAERLAEAKRHERKQARYSLPRFARAMLPWHDPRRRAALAPAEHLLAQLAAR